MKNDDPFYEPQPAPTGDGTPVGEQVIKDIQEQIKLGERRYGTVLKTNNGRSALQDAYEEVLDLAQYLKQKMMEEEGM